MTMEAAKARLDRMCGLGFWADRLWEEARCAYERATSSTRRVQHAPSHCGGQHDDVLADYAQYSDDLSRCVAELLRAQREVVQEIGRIPDRRYRLLLRARYIERLRWDEVAEAVGCCRHRAMQLHKEALKEFAESA